MQNLLPSTGYHKPFLAAQAQLQSNTGPLQAELLQSQAQLAELETQVRASGHLAVGAGDSGQCRCGETLHLSYTVPPLHLGAEAGAGAGPAQDAAPEFAAAAPGRPGAHRECTQVPTLIVLMGCIRAGLDLL